MGTTRPPEHTIVVDLRHGGRDRPCPVRVPPGVAGPAPLVVELHGRGIAAHAFDRWTGYSALADEVGFLLAMPSAMGEVWNDGRYGGRGWEGVAAVDDVGYVHAVIEELVDRGLADPARVYLVGMSNGAAMAGRIAWERPGRVAAIAQVAGTCGIEIAAGTGAATPVPILQMHGTHDRVSPYEGGRAHGLLIRVLIRRPAEPCLGVDEWAARWVSRNGAGPEAHVEVIEPDVTVCRWSGSSPGSDVVAYRLEGAGHTWPGTRLWTPPHLGRVNRTLDATRVTWNFLSSHRRAG